MLTLQSVLPGQQGSALRYTTRAGGLAQMRQVHFGQGNDDYDSALLFTPENVNRLAATPVVLYFHGSTANEQQILSGGVNHTGAQRLLDDWLDRGWIVASLRLGTTGVVDYTQQYPQWVSGTTYQPGTVVQDVGNNATGLGPLYALIGGPYTGTKRPGADPSHWQADNDDGKWGNEPLRLGTKRAWTWFRGWQKLHPKGLLLCGFSAGGASSPNVCVEAMRGVKVPVAALATIDGACNLRDNWTNLSTSRDKIGPAYGLSTPWSSARFPAPTGSESAEWVTKVDVADGGHCMSQVPLDTASFPRRPIYLSASPSDGTVGDTNNAIMFRDRLTAAGWTLRTTDLTSLIPPAAGLAPEVVWLPTAGGHGANAHFDETTISPFFIRALST